MYRLMTIGRLAVTLATTLLLCAGCDGGGDHGDIDDLDNWSGVYVGTIQSSASGAGTLILTLTQGAGDTLSGTVETTFASGTSTGMVNGTAGRDEAFLLYTPTNPTECPFRVALFQQDDAALLHPDDPDELTGRFTAFNCTQVVEGTLVVTRE